MIELFHRMDRLWMFTNLSKRRYILTVAILAFGGVCLALIPLVLGKMLDYLKTSDWLFEVDVGQLLIGTGILAAMVIVWAVCTIVGKNTLYKNTGSSIARKKLIDKSQHMSVFDLEKRERGDIAVLVANDIPLLNRLIVNDFPGAIVQLTLIVVMIILMAFSNIWLSLIYFALLIIVSIVTSRIRRKVSADIMKRQESLGKLNAFLSGILIKHPLIKISRIEPRVTKKYTGIVEEYRSSAIRTATNHGYVEPLGRIIDNLGYLISAVIGALMVSNHLMTMGMLVSFIAYATVIGNPIISFTNSLNMIDEDIASRDRILSFLDSPENPDESNYSDFDMSKLRGEITLENVSFEYVKGKKALENISLKIDAGSKIAVIGGDGSGKSTFTQLILRFISPTEGRILIDGQNIADIKRPDIRKVVGLCGNNPWLFEGTIADNISNTASREEIISMSKITYLDDYVKGIPDGYDTLVGGIDNVISLRERQRIGITRLLMHDNKIMILDDASSEMDCVTKNDVYRSVGERYGDRTVINITDDVGYLLNCDKVLYMVHGKVVGYDSHDNLMRTCPEYAEMFRNLIL